MNHYRTRGILARRKMEARTWQVVGGVKIRAEGSKIMSIAIMIGKRKFKLIGLDGDMTIFNTITRVEETIKGIIGDLTTKSPLWMNEGREWLESTMKEFFGSLTEEDYKSMKRQLESQGRLEWFLDEAIKLGIIKPEEENQDEADQKCDTLPGSSV